jgi:hypothetical protein
MQTLVKPGFKPRRFDMGDTSNGIVEISGNRRVSKEDRDEERKDKQSLYVSPRLDRSRIQARIPATVTASRDAGLREPPSPWT